MSLDESDWIKRQEQDRVERDEFAAKLDAAGAPASRVKAQLLEKVGPTSLPAGN